VKPFDLRELEVRINILLKRNQNTHDIIEFEDVEIHLEKREFKKSDTLVNITQKEFLIFEYLYKNNSRVVTRTELIEHIW
jgi:two-component system alkaline phosphatase synthesis response regulator PhoP